MTDQKPVKTIMLVKTKAADNNNKFYEINLYADGSVVGRNGRVGTSGTLQPKGFIGESGWDDLLASKTKGGYKKVDIATVETNANGSTTVKESIAEIAKREVTGNNPVLNALMDNLASQNRFQLLQATGGQIDIVDGVVKTPVGPVTLSAVQSAKLKLKQLQDFVNQSNVGSDYVETLEEYLTFVPQKIPHRRGWDSTFFSEFTDFNRQNDLLEQLENSISSYKPPVVVAGNTVEEPAKRIFGYSMSVLDDKTAFARIEKFYKDNINRGHACSHLKLKRVYVLRNDEKHEEYKAVASRIGGERQLWHGTRAHNVLSILKGGLIIPTSTGGYTITGRMFGDGIYFSDQSSKSLNYAYGYWGGGARHNNCFMLLADVAMGKSYTPSGPTGRLPAGYDSMFAVGGRSGVQNNEMIVYKLNQAHLSYLCEFDI